ncbi:MAG TPA: PIG-L family deacetylase [Kofleriaceae bacterium]
MRILYVIAHPDDEDPFTLTYLARELRCEVTLVSITRGENGQNALGDQAGAALGFLRTHEMRAAARAYGIGDVRFTSAVDYGYSRRVEEARARWDIDRLIGEVAEVIEEVRPALVLSRFSEDAEGEHAHHRASGEIARRAAERHGVARVLFGLEEPARSPLPPGLREEALGGYFCHRSQVPEQLLVGRDRPIRYAPRGGPVGDARDLGGLLADLVPTALELEPRVVHAPAGRPARITARASGPPGTTSLVELVADGLAIAPASLVFDDTGAGRADFVIAAGGAPRTARIEARIDGRPALRVEPMPPPCPPFVAPATAIAVTHPVELAPRGPVAYLAGTGDHLPAALALLGVSLTDDPSAAATILVGLRAHQVRRLPDFAGEVARGAHLVVLAQTPPFDPARDLPVPASLVEPAEEACEEDAPALLLAPDHPLLAQPNRITAADFDGWVEQRGSRFLTSWDDRYTALVELCDPGRTPQRGVFLSAPLGAGRVTYCALALHRQLPEGIPGAYRLLANLLSA